MSTEAIQESTFVREFTRELHNKNAGIFAGAGLSMSSGYVDWKGLLEDIFTDLSLSPVQETDLVTVAQYYCNKAGGSKAGLTQKIFDYFAQTKFPTENHKILARLPISTYWTTNYDKLIETALVHAGKNPDVRYTLKQLAVTSPGRDVVVYKMHGDVDHSSEAVISKDDYENYPHKMSVFVAALRGALIEKTFLFLGFGFTDPNIDHVLGRVRVFYEADQRQHYSIQRQVSQEIGQTNEAFAYQQRKQDYFIRDLKRFGIQTVLVPSYSDITRLLEKVASHFKRTSVFISGAAETYLPWSQTNAETFLHALSHHLAADDNRIISGFGYNVGSMIINGVLTYLGESHKSITDEVIVMRPFPQSVPIGKNIAGQWTEYRRRMIEHAGIAIFVFGNKKGVSSAVAHSNGMKEEFDLCFEAGVIPLPIGATGYMAAELWNAVSRDFSRFYPKADATFRQEFDKIGNPSTSSDEVLAIVLRMIKQLQKT